MSNKIIVTKKSLLGSRAADFYQTSDIGIHVSILYFFYFPKMIDHHCVLVRLLEKSSIGYC